MEEKESGGISRGEKKINLPKKSRTGTGIGRPFAFRDSEKRFTRILPFRVFVPAKDKIAER